MNRKIDWSKAKTYNELFKDDRGVWVLTYAHPGFSSILNHFSREQLYGWEPFYDITGVAVVGEWDDPDHEVWITVSYPPMGAYKGHDAVYHRVGARDDTY